MGVLSVGAVCVLMLVLATPAVANTYLVTRTGDPTPSGCHKHNCSLREALNAANSHPGADTVVLEGGKTYNLTIPRGTNGDANSGDLDVVGEVTVKRSGPRRATVNAHGIDSVFELAHKTSAATLMGLVVERGKAQFGGGIDVEHGSLTLVDSIVKGNRTTSDDGGGIDVNGGSARIIRSSIKGNRAADEGGGIFVGSRAVIVDSTVSGNTSIISGGGVASYATLTMRNDTVANNSTEENGGGVSGFVGKALLNDVTIARNKAASANGSNDVGGGIYHGSTGTFTISNSLIALNTVGTGSGDADPNCSGTFVSAGHNMRTTNDAGCIGFTSSTGDFVNASPKIGPLAHNGGPTETIALRIGSPAINRADPKTSEKRDQRGQKRDPKHPDIGAFEASG
jgi:hypothetical protein